MKRSLTLGIAGLLLGLLLAPPALAAKHKKVLKREYVFTPEELEQRRQEGAKHVDAEIPPYVKPANLELSGTIYSFGSAWFEYLLPAWGAAFQKFFPDVTIDVKGMYSSDAIRQLQNGRAHLAPVSFMTDWGEVMKFEKYFGYKPTVILVTAEAIVVLAHPENPIQKLTLQQLDNLFSHTFKRKGYEVNRFEDMGFPSGFEERYFFFHGQDRKSATYSFFRTRVLKYGSFKPMLSEHAIPEEVVEGISEHIGGIGFTRARTDLSHVKIIPLRDEELKSDPNYYYPDQDSVSHQRYPLTAWCYICVNKPPEEHLIPLVEEFLRFVLSYQGQIESYAQGFYPLSHELIRKSLRTLEP